MSGYLHLLQRNPGYRNLWLAQAISLIGDWFNTIVLSVLVANYTTDTPLEGLAISGLLLARFLPPLLFSPLAGVLVDRFDRKRLLILSDVLRVFIVLALLLADSPDRLWLIYLLTVLQFVLSAIFEPGRSALVPSLVSKADLVTANTLSSVTWSVMLAIGAIAGGVVGSLFGTAVALVIDSVSFAVSALLIAQIKLSSETEATRLSTHTHKAERGFFDGLRYVAAHPALAAALCVKFGGALGSVDALMVVYATTLFVIGEGGTGSLGILYSAFGVGAVLGPLVLNLLNDGTVRTMRRLIIIGYVWLLLGWFVLGWSPTLLVAALALTLRAMGGSVYWTYSSVILQKSARDEYLGRVFSLDMAGFYLSTVVSTLVTGWVIQQVGSEQVRQIVIGTGAVSLLPLLIWTLVTIWLERREVAVPVAGD